VHRTLPTVTHIDDSLVDALLRPDAFDHPAEDIELIETHISWVILAGDFAYKIKKPLRLDFLDFSSLDKRRACCEEEIRLNRPWAPDIYLDVVPITQQHGRPHLGGGGEPLEYAVRMRRFDQALRLDAQLAAGLLLVGDMKELGRNIAERHAAAASADPGDRERLVGKARQFARENFDHLEGVISDDDFRFLWNWTELELENLDSALWRRFDEGFVRDCHGDLHLGNLVRLPDGITTFDCIEFNPDLRYTDVFADVGFLAMDLVEKGHHDLSAHFLNRYLECSGDYDGVELLDFYFVYRCLVRAKVAAIRSRERESESERDADIEEAQKYVDFARRQATKGPRALIIMCGLSGSGKSWVSERLMAELPAIRLRSDIERKRLFSFAESESSGSGIGTGIYSADANVTTYEHIFGLASKLLAADYHVILDAAFLEAGQREAARRVAARSGRTSVLLNIHASTDVMRERLRRRAATKSDVSEANLEVLEYQLAAADAVAAEEDVIDIINDAAVDIDAIARTIRERARGS
jgi:aminoglycoside phosphotransferase family enzyme/predicted kinase